MEYAPKSVTLPGGRELTLRVPRAQDAQTLLDYLYATAEETPYLLREPGEKDMSVEQEESFIENVVSSPNDLMLLAFMDGELAGSCHLYMKTKRKLRHRASVAIALYKKFWGMGIGTAMMRELLSAAKARGVRQVELGYVDGNERGKALYEKTGFVECARMPDSFLLPDGTYRDEVFMVNYLE